MNCWRTKQLLAAFLDGELSPSETTLVEEHVASCPECAALRDRIAELPPLDLPRLDPEVETRIWERMDEALEQAWERRDLDRPPSMAQGLRDRVAGWFRMGKLSIPVPVAAAYLLLIAGLTGWNLVTYYKVQNLTVAMEERPAAVQPAPLAPAVADEREGRMMVSSITTPLERVVDDDADEQPTHISIPVYDTTTGEFLYYVDHQVDSGQTHGY